MANGASLGGTMDQESNAIDEIGVKQVLIFSCSCDPMEKFKWNCALDELFLIDF